MSNGWTEMLQEWSGHEPVHIVLILAGAWLAYEMLQHLVPALTQRMRPDYRFYALPWIPLLRLAIILTVITLIVPIVITPTRDNVLALLAGSALAIGFAIKDYISDLIAGIIFIIERPYRVGDWVRIGETYGEVVEIGTRTVMLRTADANDVTIPHSTLWHEPLSNATSGQHDLLCVTGFYVHPNHDNALVRQTLHDVALTSAYLKLDRPIVVVMEHEPFGLYYKLKAYPMDAREQFQFTADLTERGQFALRELGLSLITASVAVATH
ncbi:MAG: mechanosensitive ion channel domain-containing protein [Alphaproteobacteria bacterium]